MTYEDIGRKIGSIVDVKNRQYGDSINCTAEFLTALFPNGIPVEAYKDLGIIVRIWDKMKRIASGNQGNENAYNDIAGYGILMSKDDEEKNDEEKNDEEKNDEEKNDEEKNDEEKNDEEKNDEEKVEETPDICEGCTACDDNIYTAAIEAIKSNYPSSGYTILREALDLAMVVLEQEAVKRDEERIQNRDRCF